MVNPRAHTVTRVQISAANVLRCIARLRYGTDSSERRKHLQRDLKRFRALSDAEISDTAVDNWFRRNAAGPQRGRSIAFLYEYFSRNVALANSETKERRNLYAAVNEFLRPPKHSHITHRSSDSPAPGAFAKTGAIAQWNQNQDDLLQFRAIEGSYQIIRPHASGGEIFILEPMAIEVNEQRGSASLRMYSHNFRMREYVYTGELYASFRYGFSLIRRRHEDNPDRFALRCLNLHIGTHREAEGYVSHPCLSGIMLRGVTGTTGPIRTVGTPFIALRAPPPHPDFALAEFSSVIGELRRLHTNSSILIGEVRPPTTLFQFCSRVFSELHRDFSKGLVLHTLRPENVEKAVLSGPADNNDTPFAIWSRTVNAHASAHG